MTLHLYLQSIEEGLRTARGNTHPFLLCIGTAELITSCVVVCNSKVATVHIGKMVLSCVLVLLAVYYTYNLQYNPIAQEVLEFLQEKLLADPLPVNRKTSKSYDQLYRAIDCLERKMEAEEMPDSEDEDATQIECEQ